MADKSSHSPSPGVNGAIDEKTRLTEEEKKQNHIASEQKRRQAIRDGFDKLCELVPGLEGQGRSEGLVLGRTVEYMREQLEVRRKLVQEREARGEVVDEKFKEHVPFSPLQPAQLVSLTYPYRPLKILERLEELDRIRGPKQEDDDY